MKIGIISDTHIKNNIENFETFIRDRLSHVDMIIHLGDYVDHRVIDSIKEYKNFIGVLGNCDDNKIKETVNDKEIIEVLGKKIGIFHGHGKGKNTLDRAYNSFIDDNVDIILFGHSHQPLIKTKNKVLLLNPGSPSNKRKERWYSYIILDIDKENIDVNIRFFN